MDSDFGSGSGFTNMSGSGSGFMNESDSGSGFMNESDSGSSFMNVSGSGLMNDSDSGSGFMNVSGSGSGFGSGSESGSGPNPSSAFCLNITIIGDDIVEGVENIIVSFTPLNSQVAFVGPSNAQVNIIDDDGDGEPLIIAAQVYSEAILILQSPLRRIILYKIPYSRKYWWELNLAV